MWILSRKPFLDTGLKAILYQFLVQTGVGLKGLKGVDQAHCPNREVKLPSDPADGYIGYIPGRGYGLKKDHGYGSHAKEEGNKDKRIGPGPFQAQRSPDEDKDHLEDEPSHGYAGKDVQPVPVRSRARDSEYRNVPGATYVEDSKNSGQIPGDEHNPELSEDYEDPRLKYSDDYHKSTNNRVRYSSSKEEDETVEADKDEAQETQNPDPRERYEHDGEVKIQLGQRLRERGKPSGYRADRTQNPSRYEQLKGSKRLDSTVRSNQTSVITRSPQANVSNGKPNENVKVETTLEETVEESQSTDSSVVLKDGTENTSDKSGRRKTKN